MRSKDTQPIKTEQQLVHVYECLCDLSRLRILNLLMTTPLCVCHLEQIIGPPQARISRHLAYLRKHGMVTTQRYQNWSIYQVSPEHSPMMKLQLKCLQDCTTELGVFREDRIQLKAMKPEVDWISKFVLRKPFRAPTQGCC